MYSKQNFVFIYFYIIVSLNLIEKFNIIGTFDSSNSDFNTSIICKKKRTSIIYTKLIIPPMEQEDILRSLCGMYNL